MIFYDGFDSQIILQIFRIFNNFSNLDLINWSIIENIIFNEIKIDDLEILLSLSLIIQ